MAWSVTVDGTTVLLLFCGSLLWWYLGATHHKQTVQPPAHQGTNNASENTNTRNSFVQPSSPIPVERPESDIVTPTSAIQIPVNKKTMPARDHLVKAATSEDPHLDQNLRPIPTEDHLSHSSTSASSSTNKTYRDSNAAAKAPGTDDSDRNALPKPKCFRIANVPPTWSRDDLLDSLRKIDSSLARRDSHEYQLSLYPACYGSTQTALLNLCTCSEYFQQLKPNDFNYVKTSSGTQLVIDSHFYDLTPLNSPGDYVVADVVAVTGLAGHAFGSWRNRDTHNMWLKDFLPEDVKYVRIMTYGYDSSIVGGEKSDSRLVDYRRNFIQQLENSRSTAKDRPVIFLGHSLGGILILQTLVESNRNPHHKSILDSTRGIFFFGTPHQGLRTDELEEMIDVDSGGQRCNLIMQLKEGSEFLENQKEDLIRIWEGFKQKVVSFYETVKTPSVKESRADLKEMVRWFKWSRDFLLSYICHPNTGFQSGRTIRIW
ncbi:hypothetical protein BDD12DRAFT_290351 [Trichophaea hybrida]|nr:hypothetical protein BDD12DRAFT_290351 [Trichophaea hybrida]